MKKFSLDHALARWERNFYYANLEKQSLEKPSVKLLFFTTPEQRKERIRQLNLLLADIQEAIQVLKVEQERRFKAAHQLLINTPICKN